MKAMPYCGKKKLNVRRWGIKKKMYEKYVERLDQG